MFRQAAIAPSKVRDALSQLEWRHYRINTARRPCATCVSNEASSMRSPPAEPHLHQVLAAL